MQSSREPLAGAGEKEEKSELTGVQFPADGANRLLDRCRFRCSELDHSESSSTISCCTS